MRIIGGKHSGKRFNPPKNNPARPTTDIAKESLFNIIDNEFYFETATFLDLFGGTGSLAYEFASRGCTDITSVEMHPPNVKFIEDTAAAMGFNITVHREDVFRYIDRCKRQYKLIFAGPPYPLTRIPEIPDLIFEKDLLTPEGWFILEHNPLHDFTHDERLIDVRVYGQTTFSIFSHDRPNK